jgi:hypothetical protein
LQTELRGLPLSIRWYIQHIESLIHKKKIHQSSFNRDIIQLTQTFSNTDPKHTKNIKNIEEKMFSVTRIDDSADDIQIISNPNKKIKINENIIQEEQENQQPNQTHNCQRPLPNYAEAPPNIAYNYFKPFYSIYNEQYPYFNLNMNFYVNPYSYHHPPLHYQPNYNIMPNNIMPNNMMANNMMANSMMANNSYMPNLYPVYQAQECRRSDNNKGELIKKSMTCIIIDD